MLACAQGFRTGTSIARRRPRQPWNSRGSWFPACESRFLPGSPGFLLVSPGFTRQVPGSRAPVPSCAGESQVFPGNPIFRRFVPGFPSRSRFSPLSPSLRTFWHKLADSSQWLAVILHVVELFPWEAIRSSAGGTMLRDRLTYVLFLLFVVVALVGSGLAVVPAATLAPLGSATAHIAPLVIADLTVVSTPSPDRPICQVSGGTGC